MCCWWYIVYMTAGMRSWEVADLSPISVDDDGSWYTSTSLRPWPSYNPCPPLSVPFFRTRELWGYLTSLRSGQAHPVSREADPVCCALMSSVDVKQLDRAELLLLSSW